jgi:hypothetical protein
MFTITKKQLKTIVGPQIFNWDTAFKNTDFINLIIGTSEDNKMLKLTIWDENNPSYKENHFFEDYEEILKTIEDVLLFPAYEKTSDPKYQEIVFKELDAIFYYLGKKCTTYADYLMRNTSKDAYIKVGKYELLRLLDKLTGQPAPEDLIGKLSQEASKRKDNKLTVYFSKSTDFEKDDRIVLTVLPDILSRILTIHGYQDAIEDILLEHSYDWNLIEKEELFERIDELNKIFKVKKDKKYFENKLDLVSENFLVCPKENFLFEPTSVISKSKSNSGGLEALLSDSFKKFLNPSPFDLAGFKFEIGKFVSPVMDNRSLEEIAEEIIKKTKENKINWIKPIETVFKPRSFYDIIWDEFIEEITKETKGDKNNMNTNKNKPKRLDSIMIDEENKLVVVFLNNKKFTIKCHKDDKFDYRVGLGVAVSRLNENNKELQHLKQNMSWKAYYLYCFNKFFYFNEDKIKAFDNKVYAEKEQYKLKCNEEKVRKFKCEEVEMIPYKPKKISHNFVMF